MKIKFFFMFSSSVPIPIWVIFTDWDMVSHSHIGHS